MLKGSLSPIDFVLAKFNYILYPRTREVMGNENYLIFCKQEIRYIICACSKIEHNIIEAITIM